jgi:hypothetical protein
MSLRQLVAGFEAYVGDNDIQNAVIFVLAFQV